MKDKKMETRILFALVFSVILMITISFIPDNPSMAYPPTTPLPPIAISPIYFGVYCQYLSPVNPGLIVVKWDDPPIWFEPDTINPGVVYVYYDNILHETRPLQLNENEITKLWGTIWHPINGHTAQLFGQVKNKLGGGYITIQPTYYYQYCPEPVIYLPLIRK